MKWQFRYWACTMILLANVGLSGVAMAQHAAAVVSYDKGTTPANDQWGTGLDFDIEAAALGEPERFTGDGGMYPSVVSPFSGPYLRNEIVSIGENGHITLRLSNYVLPQAGGPEIGIFTNVSLIDTGTWPNLIGQAGLPAGAFGIDSAVVEVSKDGISWNSLGEIEFDIPTNGYTDLGDPYASTVGGVLSNFQQPFTRSFSSFDGLQYNDANTTDILDQLAGSGGGTWIDVSGTGLAQVGYIRFSVADDGDGQTGLNFELDAISIAGDAVGAAITPEPSAWMIATLLSVGFLNRWNGGPSPSPGRR